jgi:hypothetical protein
MAKVTKICSMGVAPRFSNAVSELSKPGDYVLVIRGVPRSVVMLCPDGCGAILTINLDSRAGPAWRAYVRNSALTVYPSIWREEGCKSHFILWEDRVLWCGVDTTVAPRTSSDRFVSEVLAQLHPDAFVHYETIAQAIGAIPWEVSAVCQDLLRRGLALQGKVGTFRKKLSGPGAGKHRL